jgi:hypothetical protein
MGWNDKGPDCRRCYKPTEQCNVCKGQGSVWGMFGDCTECDGSKWVCAEHGKYWKN